MPTTGTVSAAPTPPPSASPTATPQPSTAPSASSAAGAAKSEPCPLFCRSVKNGCLRPDLPKPPDSCGAWANELAGRTQGAFAAPTVPCPERCCPAKAEGTDPDADGIVGKGDACPDAPEDRDGFQDQDGCPDADNDQDGLSDVQDRCCYVAEDKDGVQDEDGCPDP